MTAIAIVSSISLAHVMAPLQRSLPDVRVDDWHQMRASEVDVAVCWHPEPGVLARFPKLALVHSVGAGVDHITSDPTLPDVPICRIVDAAQVNGMVEYIAWSVLYFHRKLDVARQQQSEQRWSWIDRAKRQTFTVGVLGLGQIGSAAAQTLAQRGYVVRGWARSAHVFDNVSCFAGKDQLPAFLAACDVVVCTLPLTEDTRNLIDADFLALCKPAVALVNCGRGGHLVTEALRAGLQSGQVRGAILDVFEPEPVPADHWAWRHPKVILTPHMAAHSSPEEIARQIARNVQRWRNQLPPLNVIRRAQGY